MVRLTVDLIARCTSGYTKKRTDEDMDSYLKRLTHLYLEGRGIDEIVADLSQCRNLTVLYLYDNKLTTIPAIGGNQTLSHIYLQNNLLSRIEGISSLSKLTKLYIAGNRISVLEGLHHLVNLQELHVENQILPPGEKLYFDPRSLMNIAQSLQVLNISGNHIDTIADFEEFRCLSTFQCNDNDLSDMKELARILPRWRCLQKIEFANNPICSHKKYRERIVILCSPSLSSLDGKEITEQSRQFLQNWQASKERQKSEPPRLTTNYNAAYNPFPYKTEGNKTVVPAWQGSMSAQNPGKMLKAKTQSGVGRRQTAGTHFPDSFASSLPQPNIPNF